MDRFVTVEREIYAYYDCLKRQSHGGHDGCMSFIPADKEGKPPGVYCQCGCPMSFHRKDVAKIEEQIEISKTKVIYGTCQKKHLVKKDEYSYRLDGCLEFKPTGLATDEKSMVCVACSCHASFHQTKYVSPN